MSKHGKNGREAKKAPFPKKTKCSTPQGFIERIVADEKRGVGLLLVRQKKENPSRVAKLYLMHKTPRKRR